MQMEAGLDTGPMILKGETPIGGKTAGELTDELALMGARLMVAALAGDLAATAQPNEGVTIAPKVSKAEARLDFSHSAVAVERAVRAYNPAPGAWCEIGGERVKILAAQVVAGTLMPGEIGDGLVIGTGEGAIQPVIVQRPGKPAMALRDLLNGWTVPGGSRAG